MQKNKVFPLRPFSSIPIHSKYSRSEVKTTANKTKGNIKRGLTAQSQRKDYRKDSLFNDPIFLNSGIHKKTEITLFHKKNSLVNKTKEIVRNNRSDDEIFEIAADLNKIYSNVYEKIFFKKATLDELMKKSELWEKPDTYVLPPKDSRLLYIYNIAKNIFQEIHFDLYALLICQYKNFPIFYVHFTDSDLIPFSECCNQPIYIKINDNNIINLLCSSKTCMKPVLVEMFIGKNEEIFNDHFNKIKKEERVVRKLISKYVITGKFRCLNLNKEVIKEKEKNRDKYFEKENNLPFIINFEKSNLKDFNKELESFDKKLELLSPIKVKNRIDSKGKILEKYQFKVGSKDVDPIGKYKNILENISFEQI